MNTMMEFCCRDCGSHYYLVRQYWHEDTGLCARCDNEIAELEAQYGPPPQPSPDVQRELRDAEWQAFLGIVGGLAFSAFAWWGLVSAARYVWRIL